MIRHFVTFSFKDGYTSEQKSAYLATIKHDLEELKDLIPGIHSLVVRTDLLPASTCDYAIDSVFESAEALKVYATHPEHLRAGALVGEVSQNRVCSDFLVD